MDNSLSFAKRYVEEMSLVEIANELGYTKESTNNLLAKSKEELMKIHKYVNFTLDLRLDDEEQIFKK